MAAKSRTLSGVILLLIIAILVAVPWVDGYFFRKNYAAYLAALGMDKIKITLLEYHQGWLSSEAKISIQNNGIFDATPQNAFMPNNIVLEQHIVHGPIIHNPVTKRLEFAEGMIHSIMHLPLEFEAILGLQPGQGFMDTTLIATFGNQFVNYFKSPVISRTIPSVGTFTWQGLNGKAIATMVGPSLHHGLMEMTIGAFTVQSPQGNLVTKDAYVKYNISRDATGLWNGSYSFSVPQLTFANATENYSLANLELMDVFNSTNNNYNNDLQLTLGQMILPGYSVSQSNLNISFKNMNATALANLIKASTQMQNLQQSPQQYEQFLATYIPPIFTPATVLSYNSNFNTSFGHAVTDGQLQWPTGVKTLPDLAAHANAKMNLRISMALVNKIIDLANQKDAGPTPAANNGTNAATTAAASANHTPTSAEQMKQQLAEFVKAGYIIVDKDDYVSAVTFEQGVWKANGHVLQ